jgi:hypothetical protein
MTRALSVAASLNQIAKEQWQQRLLEVMLDAESRKNPHGTCDLQYSAAPGGLLRKLQSAPVDRGLKLFIAIRL